MIKQPQARATVIIPTFGEAKFAKWAIKSVQNQIVRELEICIICDGSPPSMVEFFQNLAAQDPRIRVFSFPKSPRTGEPYRDKVICQTTGNIICYCSHDDLWLPDHVEAVEHTLANNDFTHSIHAAIKTPEEMDQQNDPFSLIYHANLKDPEIINHLQNNVNFFGLTYGAHTRKAYFQLSERWATTPIKEIPTDLYMWQKFITAFPKQIATTTKITALCFPKIPRDSWTENQRFNELEKYFKEICVPEFLSYVNYLAALHEYKELIAAKTKITTISNQLSSVIKQSEDQIKTLLAENSILGNNYSLLLGKQTSLKYLLKKLYKESIQRIKNIINSN
jgi:glycosyltransferase involved in cell wall biosynthesis